jgi:argininosuccinate lyase
VRDHASAEDIHHFVELKLVERVGSLGLKLHTGRSRNEQIATDLRLYVRAEIDSVVEGWRRGPMRWSSRRVRPAMP